MGKFKKFTLGMIATVLLLPTVTSSVYAQSTFFDEDIRDMFIDKKEEKEVEEVIEEKEEIQNETIPAEQEVETYAAVENKNLILNGDFEESEQAPTDPKYAGQNTYHDAGLWRIDNLKPKNFLYQMWKVDANPDNFKASYVTEADGNHYVHMDLSTKPAGTLSMFKAKNVKVDPNTQYIWSADMDIQYNPTNGVNVRAVRQGNDMENFYQQGTTDGFDFKYGIFNSNNYTGITLIFAVENAHSGEFSLDNVSLKKYDGYPLRINFVEEEIFVRVDQSQKLGIEFLPVETSNFDLIWTSEDETVATVDEVGNVMGVGVGETFIVATSPVDGTVTSRAKVKVHNDDIPIETITIENLDNTLNTEEKRYLSVASTPEYVTEELEITWESSDESVAYFEDNKLVARSAGSTTITAKHKDGTVSDSKTITVNQGVIDDYAIMRDRWRETLIGNDVTMDLNDVDIKNFVLKLDEDSSKIYETMNKKEDRDKMAHPELWELTETTFEANLTSHFSKLFTLSQAFMIEGTSLYQDEEVFNEIIEGFHFMVDVKKYNGDFVRGNWWDWQIGVPQRFVKALIVLDDYLNPQQRDKFVSAIEGYTPDLTKQLRTNVSSTSQPNAWVTATGANQTDIGINVLGSAIIAKSESRMNQIPTHLPKVMAVNETSSGDGFYTDGSFVQHQELAYTGSYGIEAIRGIANIVSIIDGTQWGFDESTPNYTNLYDIIPNTFFPIVHNGMVMGMTQGRSISRAPGTNRYAPGTSAAAELSANLLSLATYLPEDLQVEIKEHVKYWYENSKEYYDYVENARDLEMLLNMKALLADENIEAQVNEELKVMSAMARVTNIRDSFSVGVSMTSEKIANYESINKENLYGFHTGDGMLYVYNNDLEMYGEKYWPTVDWYRLPGITVDTRALPKSALHRQKSAGVKWVGGVSNGENGSAGMLLDKAKQDNVSAGFDLKAKKSYFFIDDAIVAVGSDISGTTNASIETIVENRILKTDGSNEIVLNGNAIADDATQAVNKQDWVHLTGKDANSNMGYYFLEDVENLQLARQYRSGSYADINEMTGTPELHRANYFLMSIHHGQEVTNDKYAYVMLPGVSQEQTAQEAASNSIMIVNNDSNMHAVIDEELGVFAANVFTKAETVIDLSAYDFPVKSIKVNNAPAIVIEVLKSGELSIDVSSPNNQNEKIDVELTLKDNSVVSNDDHILNPVSTGDTLNFTFDSNNMRGMSNKVVVGYSESEDLTDLIDDFKTAKVELDAKNELAYTMASWETMKQLIVDVDKFNEKIDAHGAVTVFEVKAILTRIKQVREQLVTAGDQEAIKTLIESVDHDLYTQYANGLLNDLIDESDQLFADRAEQDILDEYELRLKEALDTYDKVIDITKYEDLIDLYSNIDVNKYLSEGVLAFTDSYRELEALVDSYDPTQELTVSKVQLDAAYKQLIKDYEALELIPIDEDEVDPRLEALRKEAVQLVLKVSRLEKISDELRNETGILILMIENCETSYEDLLAQYEKVLGLYDTNDTIIDEEQKEKDKEKEKEKTKDPNTGINNNYYPWLVLLALSALFVIFNRKKRVNH